MKKINQAERNWEPAAHEDPSDPGVLKRVIVQRQEVDPNSKLMMVNLSRIPVGKTHKVHSHKTMEEIFYFTEGEGEVLVGEEKEKVGPGDRIIVPPGSNHQVTNSGNRDLLYIGIGVATD